MRRSRVKITLDILDLLATEDRRKTELVYQSNSCFSQMNIHIERLVEAGLIAFNTRTEKWYLTLAGKEAAGHLRAVEALL